MGKTKLLLFADYKTVHKEKKKEKNYYKQTKRIRGTRETPELSSDKTYKIYTYTLTNSL